MPAHPSISASLGPLLGPSSLPGDWSLVLSHDSQVTSQPSPFTTHRSYVTLNRWDFCGGLDAGWEQTNQ